MPARAAGRRGPRAARVDALQRPPAGRARSSVEPGAAQLGRPSWRRPGRAAPRPHRRGPRGGGARRARRARRPPRRGASGRSRSRPSPSSVLRLGPAAAPQVQRAVLGAAEGEHVPAAVALARTRAMRSHHADARSRSATAMHADTRKQNVQAPEIGICAAVLERGGGRLVEPAHALAHLGAGDERRPLEREPEHLEVRHAEPPPDLGGADRERPRRLGVAAQRGRCSPPGSRASRARGTGRAARAGAARAGATRRPRSRRRGSRARRSPARWPCARLPRRRPRRGSRGGPARARRTSAGSSSSHHAAQASPSSSSGVSAPSKQARAAAQRPARRCSHPSSARLLASLLGGRTGDHPAGLAAADPGGARSLSSDAPRAWSARNESLEVFSSRRRTR